MLDIYKVATRWNMDEDFVYLHQTPMFHAASLGGILPFPPLAGRPRSSRSSSRRPSSAPSSATG